MNYYFASDTSGATHVIVAANLARAREVARNADLEVVDLYELVSDMFKDEGFLVSSK